jgi:F-type H+-transporting ATPase subunit epsilon
MADGSIELEIVTPDGVLLREKVSALTAPSVDGEFGVLPGHRPLLAALKTGIVTYTKEGAEIRVAVGPGFVEIANDRAVLLTDHVARKDEIDPVQARLDLKDADEALDRYAGEPGSSEYLEQMRKELWAAARLTLYGDPPPPTVHTFQESLAGQHETFQEITTPEA